MQLGKGERVNLNEWFTLHPCATCRTVTRIVKGGTMRILLTLWFLPLVVFWGWYGLSANDYNFGLVILSRPVHDLVFQIYGNMLGVDPTEIPAMVAGACAIDSAIVLAIAAFRWRASWFPRTKALFYRFWNDIEAEHDLSAGQGVGYHALAPVMADEYPYARPVRVQPAE